MKLPLLALAAVAGIAAAGQPQDRIAHAVLHKKAVDAMAAAPIGAPLGRSDLNDKGTILVERTSDVSGDVFASEANPAAQPSSDVSTTSSSSSPGYNGSGRNWAMVYSPYQGASSSSSSCKTASQVMQDVGSIAAKNFSAIRIYATDCNQLVNVAAACQQHGLKMIVGIFIESPGINQDTYNQLNDIVSYFNGNYEMVDMIVVGNEALFNNYCSGSELASFIAHCKNTLRRAGYTGMVTTTDTVSAFQANAAALCPAIDCVGANIYSFFNGNVQPSESGNFIASQMQLLQEACPNKLVYNLESGWPTAGANHLNSVPSPENQAAFIKSVMASEQCGHTVFFTMENDMWKYDGSNSVEPYFGCLNQFDGSN